MPIKRCTLPNGEQGFKWGDSGKCYAKRTDAERQAQAAYASGYKKKKGTSSTLVSAATGIGFIKL